MMIRWYETWDANDNSFWVGVGPYSGDSGAPFWQLKQRLANNRIEWYADHDPELGGEGEFWLTLEEAKTACQNAHDRILEETASNE